MFIYLFIIQTPELFPDPHSVSDSLSSPQEIQFSDYNQALLGRKVSENPTLTSHPVNLESFSHWEKLPVLLRYTRTTVIFTLTVTHFGNLTNSRANDLG